MNCPLCNVALNMTDRQGIEIDYCPKCRGIWLDRGELEKLIELSSASLPAAPPNVRQQDIPRNESDYDRRRDDDSNYHQKPHKKESWLGRLMDFD